MSEESEQISPRGEGLRRIYFFVLALLGLGTWFLGLQMLTAIVLDFSIGDAVWGSTQPAQLSATLSTLLVGLPDGNY